MDWTCSRNDNRWTKKKKKKKQNGRQGWEKEGEEAKKEDDEEMILQLSSVRHGQDEQKTGVLGKIMRRVTFNIGWT